MPKATPRPTTPRHARQAVPDALLNAPLSPASLRAVANHLDGGAPMPSVADLGRRFAALLALRHTYDLRSMEAAEGTQAKHAAQAAYDHVYAEADAISDLIFARPISTWADAVALAVQGFQVAEINDQPELQRAFARLALMAGSAAGVEPGDFGSDYTGDLVRRHAGVGVAP